MIHLLDGSPPGQPFPDPATAETAPDGLLAMGGDLTLPRLVSAYRQGIFPWYSPFSGGARIHAWYCSRKNCT